METKAILMEYIKQELAKGRSKAIDENDDLLSAGILDSLGILQLAAFVEERFGIKVPDQDIAYENFHSVNALASYLRRE
jgi:acyl carrier protein